MSAGRDAERLPWRAVSEHAIKPPHLNVWVRLDGVWRRGWIRAWERDGAGWRVWMHYDLPVEADWTAFAWFRYDPEAIRERQGEESPGSG